MLLTTLQPVPKRTFAQLVHLLSYTQPKVLLISISRGTVGAMGLARAMELARSVSNEILDKLHKEFRPDFFTG